MSIISEQKLQADGDGFYNTAVSAPSLRPGQMIPLNLDGRSIILTRYEGRPLALAGHCPHAAARLAEGTLHRHKLTCPDHGYCFDIRNGRTLWPPDEMVRLRLYPIKEENGTIWVKVS
jgi:nitrite reductase/ring-hydroxylating ferredoxin subunit